MYEENSHATVVKPMQDISQASRDNPEEGLILDQRLILPDPGTRMRCFSLESSGKRVSNSLRIGPNVTSRSDFPELFNSLQYCGRYPTFSAPFSHYLLECAVYLRHKIGRSRATLI